MIRYQLACAHGHSFEGWFRGSEDFETQAEAGSVTCPACGSTEVAKQLMTPSVATARGKAARPVEEVPQAETAPSAAETAAPARNQQVSLAQPQMAELAEAMRRIRKHVTENAENVGPRFAEEARAMHYGETEKRGIYGEATAEDTSSLLEDGIEVYPLPILPEDRN